MSHVAPSVRATTANAVELCASGLPTRDVEDALADEQGRRLPSRACALIRAAGRWRGLRFPEFETRQLVAAWCDLEEEHTTAIAPKARTAQPSLSGRSQP